MLGAVVMVAQDGEVIFNETFGLMNLDTGQEMKPDTIFRLASMTKPITATAVMILQALLDERHP